MRTMFSPIPLNPSLAGAIASATVVVLDRAALARWGSMDLVPYDLDRLMFTADSTRAITATMPREVVSCLGGHIAYAGGLSDAALAGVDVLTGRIEARLDAVARAKSSGPLSVSLSGLNVNALTRVTTQDRGTDELSDRRYERFDGLNQT